ncbi:glycosyltransferase family 87 protein [Blastococcus sp. LR1]|uniref:glycosyltransferase family 87 protein n=1 Tax=Blastococcus sp. LR1 TaxID=2877000 RepID=UPI001CCC0CDC|nr:glycosyltransferase family 87 protein [Blastococcus sp. LR1]MCA0146416.1 DUF2029 domain-containing protein [Blastococcus sp. LR1]
MTTPASTQQGGADRASAPPVLGAVLWTFAVVGIADLAYRSYVATRDDVDFRALYDGASRFVEGGSVYADPYFLLTPSGLLAMVPFGLLDRDAAFAVWNTLSLAAAAAGVALSLRFARVPLRSPMAAGLLLGLSLTPPLTQTLMFGNLNNSLLLALGAGCLLALRDDRRALAGVLLGLSLALKPLLVLVLVIPLLRRQWATVAWALALPAVLNVIGFLVTPFREDFLEVTVPALLSARPDFNSSLWAIGAFFDVPEPVVVVVRVLVVLGALLAAWRLRAADDPVLRLASAYGVLLLATFLSAALAQGYYALLLVPLLVTAGRPGSPLASPLAWIGVVLFAGGDEWKIAGSPDLVAAMTQVRPALGWALLLAVLAVAAFRRPGGRHAPGVPAPERVNPGTPGMPGGPGALT